MRLKTALAKEANDGAQKQAAYMYESESMKGRKIPRKMH